MQWIVASLIHVILHFLEVSFRSNHNNPPPTHDDSDFFASHSSTPSDDDGGDEYVAGTTTSTKKLIQEAYAFMELTPPVTEDELKKQYKKLSLRYHPDRNGGTDESKAKFQKLRACVDWIEKDLAGVSNPKNGDAKNGDSDNDDDKEEEEDDFYEYIKRQQEIQKRYREMQEERERVMREELQRQKEQKKQFQSQVKSEKTRCRQQERQKGLRSAVGRTAAHQRFQEEAEEMQENIMSEPSQRCEKPTYDIMECNSDTIVIALRLNMPDVVLELINQQLPLFAQNKGRELYFQGRKVTAQIIKKEFMLRPLDEDSNNLLHYAAYYESYQIVNMICGTALRDDFLGEIVSQTNDHGNTPLFFAKIANDRSILMLLEAQIKLLDEMKVQREALPALAAGIKRLGELVRHLGFCSTLETLLSFGVARWVFGMHTLTSIVALFLTNVIHDESNFADQVPGVHEFSAFLCFCVLWKGLSWVFFEWILKAVKWELLLLLIPIGVIALSAKRRTSPFQRSTSFLDRLLYPLMIHAKVSDEIEKHLLLVHKYLVPKMILQTGLTRSYFLIALVVASQGLEKIVLS